MKTLILLLFLIPNLVTAEDKIFSMPSLPLDTSCWNQILNNHDMKNCHARIFADINFDGINEVIVRNFRAGQRHRDSFTVYKHFGGVEGDGRGENGNYLLEMDYPPFSMIDSASEFDPINKLIHIYNSSGASLSSRATYKKIKNKWKVVDVN